jgi:hypothetical protein
MRNFDHDALSDSLLSSRKIERRCKFLLVGNTLGCAFVLCAAYSPVCLFYVLHSSVSDQFNSLLSEGFKRADIAAAIRESRRSRHNREHSYYNRSWDNFHEKLEETSRSLKKVVGFGGKSL